MFFLLFFPSFVCVRVCMYVFFFLLVIIFRRCMLSLCMCVCVCIEKKTTNNTIRVLPYICVQIFSTSVAAIELFTFFFFLKRPTNVHCDWCVSSFSFFLQAVWRVLGVCVVCDFDDGGNLREWS